MAFISNKKRENLIKRINKSYGFRKFLICLEMAALVGFIIVTFVSIQQNYAWWHEGAAKPFLALTPLGIGMLVWAIAMTVLGIITMILILTLKSPKKITKEVEALESSALSGKKISRKESSVEVMEARKESKKNKPLPAKKAKK